GPGEESAPRDRARARTDRARGRVLRLAAPLSERRLLLGADLSVDGLPFGVLPGALRDRPNAGLARPVARAHGGPGAEDRPAPPALHRPRQAVLPGEGALKRRLLRPPVVREASPCP